MFPFFREEEPDCPPVTGIGDAPDIPGVFSFLTARAIVPLSR